ncbi:hypothetical protein F5888DRAFT_1635530 [Russula emetica]|nr:hypothetical protein F5888DRAFT_1635530 [Russula emetica]
MGNKTRSTNTDKHPGNPDKKRERRTKAQMEEFRAQEAEKQKQKELDEKAKTDRIDTVEQRLTGELDVTPRPTIKQRLRRTTATTAFLELPLGNNPDVVANNAFPDDSSLTNDDEFQPTSESATECADKTDDETETELPPKKKKKIAKEPVPVAAAQVASDAGKSKGGKKKLEALIVVSTLTSKGNHLTDGKKLPHGDNVSGLGKAPGNKLSLASELDKNTMLTLNQTPTSFYRSLMETSDKKSKLSGLNDSWAAEMSAGRPRSNTFGIPTTIRPIPSLTIGSTQLTSTSVLTNRVAITSTNLEGAIVNISDSESERGGVPEKDETKGLEWDAAAASPLKGKKRATTSALVKDEDSPVTLYQKAPQKKKFRNEDLPRGCQDDNRWRGNFIPTFLWYAAYQVDPWNLEEDAAVDAMQQIWNQLYGKAIPYQIAPHDAVYIITLQRVSDSWRNTIGSAANTSLTAFFESSKHFDTDLSHQHFATDYLKNSKFLYSDTEGPKFKGLFRGPLFIQTLAAHYTAISGAVKVTSMDPYAFERMPFAAFGISAAAVERALTLHQEKFATGTLTIDMTKSKVISLPKFLNDGSSRSTAFNDGSWGGPSRNYVISAKNLRKKSIDEIIKNTKAFLKTSRQSNSKASTSTGNFMVVNDHRANLVDESDSEEGPESEGDNDDCKFSHLKILSD